MAMKQKDNNTNGGRLHQNQTFGNNENDSPDLELGNRAQSTHMTTSASSPLSHSGDHLPPANEKNGTVCGDSSDDSDYNDQNVSAYDENGNLDENADKFNSETQDRWRRFTGFSIALGAVTTVAKIVAEDDDDDIAGNIDGSNFQGNPGSSQAVSQPPTPQPPPSQPPASQPNR